MTLTNSYSGEHLYYVECIIIFASIAGFGIIGNGTLINLITTGLKHRQPFEWLLLNLATFDFVLCVNATILLPPYIINNKSFGCKIAGFINYVCGFATLTVPTTIAVNRYLSLYKPDLCKKLFTVKNTIFICLQTWGLSIGVVVPYVFIATLGLDDLGVCGITLSSPESKLLFSFTSFPIAMMCYIMSAICGLKVIKMLKEHEAGNNEGHSEFQSRLLKETRELVNLVALMLIIPTVTQLPVAFTKFLLMFFNVGGTPVSRMITALFPLASASNPYLTMYLIKNYRKQVIKYFCHKQNIVVPCVHVSNTGAHPIERR